MSEARELTRQPRAPSQGGPDTIDQRKDDQGQITPEQALAEAQEARRIAEEERDQARTREQTLAKERDEARAREQTAAGDAVSARERSLTSSIDTQKAIADQAKRDIAIAQTAGDSVAVAEAFDKLADARAKLNSLDQQKQYFDSERERLKAEPPRQPQTEGAEVRTPGGSLRVSSAAKSWMDGHNRFYTDRAYYNHAIAAHASITGDGIQEGSPAYFRALDETMAKFERYEAFERGDLQKEDKQVNQTTPRRPAASSVGAPVGRDSAPRERRGEVSESVIAQFIGVLPADLREYARYAGFRGEEGYKRYLAEQQTIMDLNKSGQKTGLEYGDGVYR